MIVEEKIGDITEATEPIILFATNQEGWNDAGLAGQMFEKFPRLEELFPQGKTIGFGPHLVRTKNKQIIVLCCHSLKENWKHNTTEEAIRRLEWFEHVNLGRIAIPMIGTGAVGRSLRADWNRIKQMFEESPLEFVLYRKER